MVLNSINKYLRNTAVEHGLCNQWQSEWQESKSTAELCDMFKRGMDFCIKHDYPNKDVIKHNFNRDELNENSIYVDQSVNINGTNGTYVFIGDCQGCLNLRPYSAALIYVRHNSKITINSGYECYINIFIRDDSEVEIGDVNESAVKIFRSK